MSTDTSLRTPSRRHFMGVAATAAVAGSLSRLTFAETETEARRKAAHGVAAARTGREPTAAANGTMAPAKSAACAATGPVPLADTRADYDGTLAVVAGAGHLLALTRVAG